MRKLIIIALLAVPTLGASQINAVEQRLAQWDTSCDWSAVNQDTIDHIKQVHKVDKKLRRLVKRFRKMQVSGVVQLDVVGWDPVLWIFRTQPQQVRK